MPREVYGQAFRFLPHDQLLTFEEITRLAGLATSLGVRKIRLTGGEPLLRRDLERLVGMLAALPGLADLTLTTNGSLLAEKAAALAEAGLQRVTVSLDSLDDEVFARLNDVRLPGRARARGPGRRGAGGPGAHQGQHGRPPGHQRGQHPAHGTLRRASGATRCATSSTWTWVTPTAGTSARS